MSPFPKSAEDLDHMKRARRVLANPRNRAGKDIFRRQCEIGTVEISKSSKRVSQLREAAKELLSPPKKVLK